MKEVSFIIPGRPIGKARPRVNRNGHCWTPDKTTDYERKIKMAYWTQNTGIKCLRETRH